MGRARQPVRGTVSGIYLGFQYAMDLLHWLSYGTSVWQLRDSAEQNGAFKIESKKAKAETFMCKTRVGLPATLERSDIVRIVNIAWQKSFGRVDTNLKAIAECGWAP
jgi:hypothetical protein